MLLKRYSRDYRFNSKTRDTKRNYSMRLKIEGCVNIYGGKGTLKNETN